MVRVHSPLPFSEFASFATPQKIYAVNWGRMQGAEALSRSACTMYTSERKAYSNAADGEIYKYGGYRQAAKTLGCGSSIREFESLYPPHNLITRRGIAKR